MMADAPAPEAPPVQNGTAQNGTTMELSFPASDPPSATPESGVHLDASVVRRLPPSSPALRRLVIGGLQAAYQREAAALATLPQLRDAATAPLLRQHLQRSLESAETSLEKLQRALACFGVSHDPAGTPPFPGAATAQALHLPAGAMLDLAAGIAVRADRAAALSTFDTVAEIAEAAGLTEPVPFVHHCASSARRELDELTRLCRDELVAAVVQAGGAPLPEAFVRCAFGAVPDAQAEASR